MSPRFCCALCRPAADPRRGDRTPCGAAAPRGTGAGARAAAGVRRPRGLTDRPSIPAYPRRRRPRVSAHPEGWVPGPPLRAPDALAGRAGDGLESGHGSRGGSGAGPGAGGGGKTCIGAPTFSSRSASRKRCRRCSPRDRPLPSTRRRIHGSTPKLGFVAQSKCPGHKKITHPISSVTRSMRSPVLECVSAGGAPHRGA
jgi:hypothetical protein